MQIFRRIMSCAEAGVRVRATIWVAPLSLSLLKRARVQQRATCSVHAASNVASANNILIFLCSMSCSAAGHVAGPDQARLTWLQSLDPTDGTCPPLLHSPLKRMSPEAEAEAEAELPASTGSLHWPCLMARG